MLLPKLNFLSEVELPQWMVNYPYLIPGAIVILGIVVYGFKDLARLSLGRMWAISGVCFRDAIRRRVLWITPLAMIAVVIVSQLQNAVDEPDAIRQTIKFCFFTSGIVVTVIALITAATNLQREIENRVIFTIVTKPVTRLEIVFGKLIGFGRVSATILVILGLFTTGYLHLRSWSMQSSISQRLADPTLDASSRERLSHFQSEGLLTSRTISEPVQLSQFSKVPEGIPGTWIRGSKQVAYFPFHLKSGDLFQGASNVAKPDAEKAYLYFTIPSHKLDTGNRSTSNDISIQIWDAKCERLLFAENQLIYKTDPTKPVLATVNINSYARVTLLPNVAKQLEDLKDFTVRIDGTQGYLYQLDQKSVVINVGWMEDPNPEKMVVPNSYAPTASPILKGSQGSHFGQQLTAKDSEIEPVAVYSFQDTPTSSLTDGRVPFEFKVAIDHTGDNDVDVATQILVSVKDVKTGKVSDITRVYPENRKTTYFSLPADQIQGSDFDVMMTCATPGHELELNRGTLLLVVDRQPFAMNLFKGMFVLWMFSMLVAAIAFLTSTFLSWPIAVVLTIIFILGKWIVSNLDIGTGIGAQFAQEYTQSDTTASTVVNQTVETLTRMLNLVTVITPDIDSFGVTEQVERGMSITWVQLGDPMWVLLSYGLPVLALAYVILRNKEVAP